MDTCANSGRMRPAVRLIKRLRSERGFIGIGFLLCMLIACAAIGGVAHLAGRSNSVPCPYALPSLAASKISGTTSAPPNTEGCSLQRMAGTFATQVKTQLGGALWQEVTGGALGSGS